MTRTILLDFDETEEGLHGWLEKIGTSGVKRILSAIYSTTGRTEDATGLLNMVKDGLVSIFPTENMIELGKLQERNRVTEEFQEKLSEKQNIVEMLQTEIVNLRQDVVISRGKLEQSEHVNDKNNLQKELERRDQCVIDSRFALEIEKMLQRCLMNTPASMGIDGVKELIAGPLKKIEQYVDKFDTKCSVDKGRAMEDRYYRMLLENLPNHEVNLVRDTPHEMDLRIVSGESTVLIDVKNYTHNVTTKEVAKFDNDVRTNRVPSILASSMSGVANKKHFQIDFVDARYPVCYLSNIKDDIEQVLSAITIVSSLEQFASSQSTGIRLDNVVVKRINDKLYRITEVLKEMTELNEQQKRLIRKIHVNEIIELVGGSIAGAGAAAYHKLEAFLRDCTLKSDDPDARFNIRSALRLWKLNSSVYGNPPKTETLKRDMETALRTKSVPKRVYGEVTEHHIFEGWVLRGTHSGAVEEEK